MKTVKQQIQKKMAQTILARVRETRAKGYSGTEVKKEIIRLLDNFIKS
jgi:hypothetical protein